MTSKPGTSQGMLVAARQTSSLGIGACSVNPRAGNPVSAGQRLPPSFRPVNPFPVGLSPETSWSGGLPRWEPQERKGQVTSIVTVFDRLFSHTLMSGCVPPTRPPYQTRKRICSLMTTLKV